MIYAKISFPFNILRTYRQNFTKYYAIILTRSTFGLLHIIFCSCVPALWPLIYSKISFPLNILSTNGQFLTKLNITIYTDKIYLGLLAVVFHKFVRELWLLIDVRITFQLNILVETLVFYCMQSTDMGL